MSNLLSWKVVIVRWPGKYGLAAENCARTDDSSTGTSEKGLQAFVIYWRNLVAMQSHSKSNIGTYDLILTTVTILVLSTGIYYYKFRSNTAETCPTYNYNVARALTKGEHELTLALAWISNHLPGEVWDEFTYPFPNFNGRTVEVWEWIRNFILHFVMNVSTYGIKVKSGA